MKGFTALPSGWFETKVSYEYDVTLGKMIQSVPTDKAYIPCQYHKSATIQDGKLLEPAEGMYASADEIENLQIQKGDLLVCEGGDIGRSAIVESEQESPVIIQNSAHRVRSNGNYSVQWLYYVLRFFKDSCLINVEISGTNTISHFTNEIFRSMIIPFPPVELSNKYIYFLDCKIAKINAAIKNCQSLLEALVAYRQSLITRAVTKGLDPNVEMKDSGVEWIGSIPREWKTSKISFVSDVTLGKMLCPRQTDSEQTLETYLCAGSISWDGVKDYIKEMWFSSKEKSELLLIAGDVLVVEGGAGFGMTTLYKGEHSPCYFQNSIIRVRGHHNVMTSDFINYWMRFTYTAYLKKVCNEATFSHYTKEKVSETPILVPPLNEQKKIADFCKLVDERVKTICAGIENQISKLNEYRSSLISAAVTGQLAIDEEVSA